MSYAHLTDKTAEVLTWPMPERIVACQKDRWIGYAGAIDTLGQLDDLLAHPRTQRMRNLLIVGRSGNGKTASLEHFIKRHPILIAETGAPVAPIVRIEMPETPDESELWSCILWALGISHRERDPASIKKRQVKTTMQYADVRMLVIDEFNNLANAGKRAGELLAAIKNLSNELRISVVAAGTPAAIHALNSDLQMRSRFDAIPLSPWKRGMQYQRFLETYERVIPLAKPSQMGSTSMATALYDLGGETIGGTVKLLKAASVEAIRSGAEQITPVVLAVLNWHRRNEWDKLAAQV